MFVCVYGLIILELAKAKSPGNPTTWVYQKVGIPAKFWQI